MNFESHFGTKFYTSPHLTITVEDWSGVRSPSRAARRRRQGHRQNIRHRIVPDPNAYAYGGGLHMHPETLREFLRIKAMQGGDDGK